MNVRLRMYKYCYLNLGAIYAKGLYMYDVQIWDRKENSGEQ